MRKKMIKYLFCFMSGLLIIPGCFRPADVPVNNKTSLAPKVINLNEGDVFTGGTLLGEDTNKNKNIKEMRFEYLMDNEWILIDTDDGGIADSDTKDNVYVAYWNINDLKPGNYKLKVVITNDRDEKASNEINVIVSPKPVPQASLLPREEWGRYVFEASESYDIKGTEIVKYSWQFDNDEEKYTGVRVEHIFQDTIPHFISLTVMNKLGAHGNCVYFIFGDILLKILYEQIGVALNNIQTKMIEIDTEKKKLRKSLNPQNQQKLDVALKKLEEARKHLEQAKKHFKATPPDIKKGKDEINNAGKKIEEAIEELKKIDQEKQKIKDNIEKLLKIKDNLLEKPGQLTLKADELLKLTAILKDLKLVINDKTTLLASLNAVNKKILEDALKKLKEAAQDCAGAEAALKKVPPDISGAKAKVGEARQKIKDAIGELDKIKEQRPKIEENIKELKRLYLMLGILSGKLWLLEEIGLDNPHADIPFPDLTMDSYPHYNRVKRDLQMGKPAHDINGDDNAFDDAVLYHELDHHLLYMKNKENMPGGSHWYDEKLGNEHLAWSEGWANFSSCAKRKDPHYLDKDEDDKKPPAHHFTKEKDLENDRCKNTGEKDMHDNKNKGADVEGSVSGILWDIFDGKITGTEAKDTDKDGVSIPFKYIWEAVNLKKPKSIKDFYKGIKEVIKKHGLNVDNAKLDKIFTDHGVKVP